MTKFDYAATLAASLATLLRQAARRRRPGPLRRRRARLAPPRRHAGAGHEDHRPARSAPSPTARPSLAVVLHKSPTRSNRRGVVIIISDLLTDLDAFYDGLGRLQHHGHEVLIFQVLDRDEIELPFDDSVLFQDIEGDEELFAEPWAFRKAYKAAMEQFIDEVQQPLPLRAASIICCCRPSEDLGLALSHYLHGRQRRGCGRARGKISTTRTIRGAADMHFSAPPCCLAWCWRACRSSFTCSIAGDFSSSIGRR